MGLFRKASPEPTGEDQYPCTVVLRAKTPEDKDRLLSVLEWATYRMAVAEPENWAAQQVYAAIRSYLPPPVKPRSANVVQFPDRRTS